MSSQEILDKAIKKATANGWRYIGNDRITDDKLVFRIGFNHFDIDFFKALWGEKKVPGIIGIPRDMIIKEDNKDYNVKVKNSWVPIYQWRLQRMIIVSDPIKYLGEHLDD